MSTTIRIPQRRTQRAESSPPLAKRQRTTGLRGRGPIAEWITSPPFLGWLAARVVLVGALAFTRYLVNDLGTADPAGRPPSGLIGWDAVWYVRIVRSGYEHLPWESMRFFPLLPTLATILRPVFGARGAVLVVVNVSALAAGFLLARLARIEKGDGALGDRAGWLLALLPPAFVLAMGYAEALFVVLSIATFLALRKQRFGWAAVAGMLTGLSRPLGVLIAIPAVVEAARGWSRTPQLRDRLTRVAAAVAPLAGMGTYVLWAGVKYGDPLRPFTVQQAFDRRGGFQDPVTRLIDTARQLSGGVDIGSGLHLPWALGFIAMLVVVFRRWPVSYGLFAAAILLAALSAENLDSLERYGLSAFPLVLAVAEVIRVPWAEKVALVLCGAGLTTYATLAFLGAYVP